MSWKYFKSNEKILTWNHKPIREWVSETPYPTDGLIDYWSFDDTLAGVNGNTWVADDGLTYVYETNGSGKCIKNTHTGRLYILESMFPGFEANTTSWTIAFWAYIGGTTHTGLGKGKLNTLPAGCYGFATNSTILRLGNFGCDRDTSGLSLSGRFYHIVITLNRTDASHGTYKLYVDNVLKNTFENGCLPSANANDFQLFRLWQNQYSDVNCKYDDVFLYSKVLSDSERTQIYNNGSAF